MKYLKGNGKEQNGCSCSGKLTCELEEMNHKTQPRQRRCSRAGPDAAAVLAEKKTRTMAALLGISVVLASVEPFGMLMALGSGVFGSIGHADNLLAELMGVFYGIQTAGIGVLEKWTSTQTLRMQLASSWRTILLTINMLLQL
ncbi:Citrate transporter [Sesbania bispinosa]|nr:Citrate transporter [Sesbania bispinosa]